MSTKQRTEWQPLVAANSCLPLSSSGLVSKRLSKEERMILARCIIKIFNKINWSIEKHDNFI